ncbi:MAG: glycosyltransferase, partial [Bacteroidales bacterium]
ELGMPENRPVILLQGAGINIQRGAEELVEAMQYLDGVQLYIIGGGDVIGVLKRMQKDLSLEDKILFLPRMPFEELQHYTANADIGLSIDKDTNINYRYSLPNKLFDYINAGLPVLASPLIEVKNIIDTWHVGETIESHHPEHIAEKIRNMLNHPERLQAYRQNCLEASKTLNWQNEKQQLIEILKKYA